MQFTTEKMHSTLHSSFQWKLFILVKVASGILHQFQQVYSSLLKLLLALRSVASTTSICKQLVALSTPNHTTSKERIKGIGSLAENVRHQTPQILTWQHQLCNNNNNNNKSYLMAPSILHFTRI